MDKFPIPMIGRFCLLCLWQSREQYAYCGNNPVVYDDPSGHKRKVCSPQGKISESVDEGGIYTNLDDGLNFSNKALEHMGESGRQVPVQTLQDAIRYGEVMPECNNYYTRIFQQYQNKKGTMILI